MSVREKWCLRYVVGPRSIQNTDEYLLCKFSVPRGGVEKTENEKQKKRNADKGAQERHRRNIHDGSRRSSTPLQVYLNTYKPLQSDISIFLHSTAVSSTEKFMSYNRPYLHLPLVVSFLRA